MYGLWGYFTESILKHIPRKTAKPNIAGGEVIMEKLLNILSIIIMIESFTASIPLFIYQKWGSGLYWFSVGLLNLAVIFLIKKHG